MKSVLWIYVGIMCIGTILLYFIMPETKDISLEEVEDKMTGRKSVDAKRRRKEEIIWFNLFLMINKIFLSLCLENSTFAPVKLHGVRSFAGSTEKYTFLHSNLLEKIYFPPLLRKFMTYNSFNWFYAHLGSKITKNCQKLLKNTEKMYKHHRMCILMHSLHVNMFPLSTISSASIEENNLPN